MVTKCRLIIETFYFLRRHFGHMMADLAEITTHQNYPPALPVLAGGAVVVSVEPAPIVATVSVVPPEVVIVEMRTEVEVVVEVVLVAVVWGGLLGGVGGL